MDENGFDEYKRLILYRLDKLDKEVAGCRSDIQGLKIKSGLWGALAGIVGPIVALIYALLTGRVVF